MPGDAVTFRAHSDPFDALLDATGNVLYIIRPDEYEVDRIVAIVNAEHLLRRFTADHALACVHLWDTPRFVCNYFVTLDPRLREAVDDYILSHFQTNPVPDECRPPEAMCCASEEEAWYGAKEFARSTGKYMNGARYTGMIYPQETRRALQKLIDGVAALQPSREATTPVPKEIQNKTPPLLTAADLWQAVLRKLLAGLSPSQTTD